MILRGLRRDRSVETDQSALSSSESSSESGDLWSESGSESRVVKPSHDSTWSQPPCLSGPGSQRTRRRSARSASFREHEEAPTFVRASVNLVRWTDAVYLDHPALGSTYPAGRPTGSSSLSAQRPITVADFHPSGAIWCARPMSQEWASWRHIRCLNSSI